MLRRGGQGGRPSRLRVSTAEGHAGAPGVLWGGSGAGRGGGRGQTRLERWANYAGRQGLRPGLCFSSVPGAGQVVQGFCLENRKLHLGTLPWSRCPGAGKKSQLSQEGVRETRCWSGSGLCSGCVSLGKSLSFSVHQALCRCHQFLISKMVVGISSEEDKDPPAWW